MEDFKMADETMHGMPMNNDTHMMMMMMQMYFTADKEVTLFFKQWKTTTIAELFGTCVFCFIMAMLYEGFKAWRLSLVKKKKSILAGKHHAGYSAIEGSSVEEVSPKRLHLVAHSMQTLLHMFQLTAGYLLMLAVMTYNVWVGVAIILGSGLGFFIFSWTPLTVEDTLGDHCNM